MLRVRRAWLEAPGSCTARSCQLRVGWEAEGSGRQMVLADLYVDGGLAVRGHALAVEAGAGGGEAEADIAFWLGGLEPGRHRVKMYVYGELEAGPVKVETPLRNLGLARLECRWGGEFRPGGTVSVSASFTGYGERASVRLVLDGYVVEVVRGVSAGDEVVFTVELPGDLGVGAHSLAVDVIYYNDRASTPMVLGRCDKTFTVAPPSGVTVESASVESAGGHARARVVLAYNVPYMVAVRMYLWAPGRLACYADRLVGPGSGTAELACTDPAALAGCTEYTLEVRSDLPGQEEVYRGTYTVCP